MQTTQANCKTGILPRRPANQIIINFTYNTWNLKRGYDYMCYPSHQIKQSGKHCSGSPIGRMLCVLAGRQPVILSSASSPPLCTQVLCGSFPSSCANLAAAVAMFRACRLRPSQSVALRSGLTMRDMHLLAICTCPQCFSVSAVLSLQRRQSESSPQQNR